MKRVPEREAAKAAGERFYFTGKPCKNGHISKRYTGTGVCGVCASTNSIRCQRKGREHPARTEARKLKQVHYSTGIPCKHGHDRRFTSNGICIECDSVRQGRYHKARPGLDAKWARQRRAKNPFPHREQAVAWMKRNPDKVKEIALRVRHNRRARELGAEGSFTPQDIDRIRMAQRGKCAACRKKTKRLEVDHIVAISRGGHNNPSNLQLLCRSCNAQKSYSDPLDWAKRRGLLV